MREIGDDRAPSPEVERRAAPLDPAHRSRHGARLNSDPTPSERLILIGVTLYALLVPLALSVRWPIGFDEGWHVLFAELPLERAFYEFRFDAHPPLSYLLLRPFAWLGTEPVWPRLLSVLPGAVQPYLLFRLLRRIEVRGPVALIAAALFAVSFSFATIVTSVRAYSLAEMFLLLEMIAWVDLLAGPDRRTKGSAWRFSAFAVLAAWTEYPSAFVSAGLLGAGALVAATSAPLRTDLARRLRDASLATPAACFAAGHLAVVAYWAMTYRGLGLPHLAPWFLGPDQSAIRYFVGGSLSILRTFTPLDFEIGWLGIGALGAVALGLGAVFVSVGGQTQEASRRVFLVALVFLWAGLFVLGTAGAYPFGGLPRQQYILFPLLLVAAAIGLDGALRTLPSGLQTAILVFVLLAAIGTSGRSFQRHLVPGHAMWAEHRSLLFNDVVRDTPLLVSNYGFIGLYGSHHDLGWRFVGEPAPGLEQFEVGAPEGRGWVVYRHRGSWMVPPSGDDGFREAARTVLTLGGHEKVRVFTPRAAAEPLHTRRRRRREVAEAYARDGFVLLHWHPFNHGEAYWLELSTTPVRPSKSP